MEKKSNFIDTGSTVQTPGNSEKVNSSSENSITPTLVAQRSLQSKIAVALAFAPAITPRTIHILDPSDIDPPFSIPPPVLTETVARRSKSFNHQNSIDATFCDKQTTFALENGIDEPSNSSNLPYLKTASDFSSKTFSLSYPKLSSILYSASSVD